MSEADKKQYLEFAKNLAYEAGEIMRKYFLATKTEWKSDNTPLTQADTEINRLVIERIAAEFPEHSVLGEEESDMKGGALVWVCDPVDGTMPYSHGLPISTFSLALCEDGVPQVGVVYDPFMDRLFYASKDGGAFCNDERISVHSKAGFAAIAMDVQAFPTEPPRGVTQVGKELATKFESLGARTTSLWSSIMAGCLVASGYFSAALLNINTPHDAVTVKIIVEEAGGKVTDLFGNDQRYDRPTRGFIASNGVIHDELVRMVQEANGSDESKLLNNYLSKE